MMADDKYLKGAHVALVKDLTRYNKELLKGSVGTTVGRATQAFYNDGYNSRFVKVKFPTVTIDILWDGLELVNEQERS
jgi:hypothetical protein